MCVVQKCLCSSAMDTLHVATHLKDTYIDKTHRRSVFAMGPHQCSYPSSDSVFDPWGTVNMHVI